jgi:hypothetical protein
MPGSSNCSATDKIMWAFDTCGGEAACPDVSASLPFLPACLPLPRACARGGPAPALFVASSALCWCRA